MNYISLTNKDSLTIKQQVDAGIPPSYDVTNRSLFDILGITPPKYTIYDKWGSHMSRFAKKYEKIRPNKIPTRVNKLFWVGVREGSKELVPICRRNTSCFSPKPVFQLDSVLIFDMASSSHALFPSEELYVVPMEEYWALQET